MENMEKVVDVLNDLIVTNNDRIEGYEKAALETKDLSLKSMFEGFARDSRKFASELAVEVAKLGGKVATGTSTAGDMYRVWMDIKSLVTGSDRKAILGSCEEGEDVAQAAYNKALKADVELSSEVRQLILTQQEKLKEGHDAMRDMRDSILA